MMDRDVHYSMRQSCLLMWMAGAIGSRYVMTLHGSYEAPNAVEAGQGHEGPLASSPGVGGLSPLSWLGAFRLRCGGDVRERFSRDGMAC
jgi:hypothetical protein